jgi:acetyl-CoA carboxylase carboxyl transferase subunit beta
MERMARTDACPGCGAQLDEAVLRESLHVCPSCGRHLRIGAQLRIQYLCDPGSFEEFEGGIESVNPIDMEGYEDKLAKARVDANLSEAVVTGTCSIMGRKAVLGCMSFDFIGGSMGSVVGEKMTRAILKGAAERLPVIVYASSGGARMQEGIFSLMQMSKTASACGTLDEAGIPFFVVLCDPTSGGVTASFAMLGDVTLAEPGAFVGFAGPRVIEGTIGRKLPEGFQRAEFLLEKGFIDAIVPRKDQRAALSFLIDAHAGAERRAVSGPARRAAAAKEVRRGTA